tara:strand:+ start:2375 stop:3016 length:642 start_codon:yes stop_codon:yes gene_type:complete
MKILVFDTETTGLPTNKYESKKHKWYKYWGHIVQISWILYDSEKHKILDMSDYIINISKDIELPESSVKIHGITRTDMEIYGQQMKEVLPKFIDVLNMCDCIVGHNIAFDINMVRAEFLRRGCVDYFLLVNKPFHCTMKENINYCKLEVTTYTGRKYFKYPKLMELHKKIYDNIPENLHNSLIDVIVCLRCYLKLKYNIEITDTCKEIQNYLT